jgi:NADPH:quinone reductase-like Zn-dependent oxidoreductase
MATTTGDLNAQATTMQAIVQHQYGPAGVLELQHVDKPRIGDDEVLVRVHAAGVHIGD